MRFDEVLTAADGLSPEAQDQLVEILERRRIARRRAAIARDVADARNEFHAGGCRPVSPAALMDELAR